MVNDFLVGNRRFVEKEFNRNRDYYSSLSGSQHPKILWIGCSDSRVSEDVITDSKPGSIFVHRNVTNIVAFNDINIASIIEYAITHLEIPDIVVCGHYNCGGVRAMLDGVEEHYIADWLLIASGAIEKAKQMAREMKLSQKELRHLLAEENVKLQIKHLRGLALIRNLHKKGTLPRIHGWIYSVESGKIKVLIDGDKKEALQTIKDDKEDDMLHLKFKLSCLAAKPLSGKWSLSNTLGNDDPILQLYIFFET